jgi:hypothetical protein
MKSEVKQQAANSRRILGRLLATELGPEELKVVRGSLEPFHADVSTLLATGIHGEDS